MNQTRGVCGEIGSGEGREADGGRERKVGERLEGIWWWQLLNTQNRISG